MNENRFFRRHPGMNESQKNMAKAMLMAGASETVVWNSVRGMGLIEAEAPETNSLTCPSCGGLMKVVTLANDRKCRYCQNDRVALPFKKGGGL